MAHSMQTLMQSILKQRNLPAWHTQLFEQWHTIVGTLNQVMRLEKINGNILIIGVYDASWMQELYMLSPILIQTINKHLDQPHVNRIRFKQVARNSAIKKEVIKSSTLQQPSLPPLTHTQQAVLERITDAELRTYLHTFLGRCATKKSEFS